MHIRKTSSQSGFAIAPRSCETFMIPGVEAVWRTVHASHLRETHHLLLIHTVNWSVCQCFVPHVLIVTVTFSVVVFKGSRSMTEHKQTDSRQLKCFPDDNKTKTVTNAAFAICCRWVVESPHWRVTSHFSHTGEKSTLFNSLSIVRQISAWTCECRSHVALNQPTRLPSQPFHLRCVCTSRHWASCCLALKDTFTSYQENELNIKVRTQAAAAAHSGFLAKLRGETTLHGWYMFDSWNRLH